MASTKRRRLEKHGRRTLAWAVAGFLLLQFVGGLLLDHVVPGIRFPTAAHRFRTLEESPQAPEVFLFGSSRFGLLDTNEIDRIMHSAGVPKRVRTFNGSVEAGDLISAEHMLRELSRHGAHPTHVVIEVSPETVTYYNRWVLEHLRRQFTWKDVPNHVVDAAKEGQLHRFFQARLLPVYMHRRQLVKQGVEALAKLWEPTMPPLPLHTPPPLTEPMPAPAAAVAVTPAVIVPVAAVSEPAPVVSEPLAFVAKDMDPTKTKAPIEVDRWLRDYKAGGGTSEAALERILARCEKRGIKVLLVGVPVASAHRAKYTPAIDAEYRAFIERMKKSHACTFVDLRDRLPDHLFMDHHHTTIEGGAALSQVLAREAIIPAWKDGTVAEVGR